MAIYAYNTLGLKNMLVVDDVTTFGKGVADNFQKKFESLGGKVTRVGAGKDTTDFNSIITNAKASNPDGVYYGGVVTSGGGLLLKQLRQQGLTIPFTGPDGIVNGAGDAKGSLIQIAGAKAADNSVRNGCRDRRLPGKEGLRSRIRRALQGRRGLQDRRLVQRPRVRLCDGHPRSRSKADARRQRERRPGGHPRGRPRLRVRSYPQVRDGPRDGVVRQERRHHPAVHLVLQD